LPADVVSHTRQKYMEAFRLLTHRTELQGAAPALPASVRG